MFKRGIAILLIIALAATSFQRYVVCAGFELNRNYIAKNLCINRNKPQLHCNGKCYFMRKLKEAQQREADNEQQSQKSLFQESFFQNVAAFQFHTHLIAVINTPYKASTPVTIHHPLLRPPSLV